jgi:glyoxylase-like metal-dependent hydrolase (beta-lactamase superfamily II)
MALGDQAFVTVHALSAGNLTLPERFFISPSSPIAIRTVPSLAFLIQHTSLAGSPKTTRLLFDLGLRREPSAYSAPIRKHISTRQPMSTSPDVIASLAQGGLTPNDIDYVILSHVHWDHVGMPSDFADPRTHFLVGPGSLDLLNGMNKIYVGSHCHFEADLLPQDRTIELPDVNRGPRSPNKTGKNSTTSSLSIPPWRALGDFIPHTIDLFGDGSLYIVHAPGHLPGHINVLARTSATKSIYLAGDACHDIRLFNGTHEIATWQDDAGKMCCIHVDKVKAEETIERIRKLAQKGPNGADVEVVFAHSPEWEAQAKERGRFWPGML